MYIALEANDILKPLGYHIWFISLGIWLSGKVPFRRAIYR